MRNTVKYFTFELFYQFLWDKSFESWSFCVVCWVVWVYLGFSVELQPKQIQ